MSWAIVTCVYHLDVFYFLCKFFLRERIPNVQEMHLYDLWFFELIVSIKTSRKQEKRNVSITCYLAFLKLWKLNIFSIWYMLDNKGMKWGDERRNDLCSNLDGRTIKNQQINNINRNKQPNQYILYNMKEWNEKIKEGWFI